MKHIDPNVEQRNWKDPSLIFGSCQEKTRVHECPCLLGLLTLEIHINLTHRVLAYDKPWNWTFQAWNMTSWCPKRILVWKWTQFNDFSPPYISLFLLIGLHRSFALFLMEDLSQFVTSLKSLLIIVTSSCHFQLYSFMYINNNGYKSLWITSIVKKGFSCVTEAIACIHKMQLSRTCMHHLGPYFSL